MSWVLRQPSPQKEVLLQVLSGVSERECARNLGLSARDVDDVIVALSRGPALAEDDCVMAYRATANMDEFCRRTGEGEGVYRLMALRYPKDTAMRVSYARPAPPASPVGAGGVSRRVGTGAGDQRPATSVRGREPGTSNAGCSVAPASLDGAAASRRREERRVARERERARRQGHDLGEASLGEGHVVAAPGERTLASEREERPLPVTAPEPRDEVLASGPSQTPSVEVMVSSACAQAAGNRPTTFGEFLSSLRRECDAHGLTAEAVPGNAALRRMLERDDRVMWVDPDAFWFLDWHECAEPIRRAVEHEVLVDHEYAAEHLYGSLRRLMRRVGIRTPAELYEVLRHIYLGTDDDIVFGNHLSVGFGRIDRQKQVKGFVADRPGRPKNILAMEYEREYGFSAGTVAIWIDLFAQPEQVSLSDWLDQGSADEPRQIPLPTPQPTPSQRSEPAPRRVRLHGTATVSPRRQAFIDRELTAPVCDAGLVSKRFAYEFPGERDITEDARALMEAGYYRDHGLLFQIGVEPEECFARLLSSRPSFSRGDPGFEESVWRHPQFRRALQRALRRHRIFLYEPESYLGFGRLHEVLGVEMTTIESYAPSVAAAVPPETPFTIRSLGERLGFSHALDELELPTAFYEGLLDASGRLASCTMAGTKVFETGVESLSASDFVEWLVAGHEGIEREDMLRLLQKEYGIDYPMASLVTAAYNSSVYHDDVGDAYYSSREAWIQEVHDELA